MRRKLSWWLSALLHASPAEPPNLAHDLPLENRQAHLLGQGRVQQLDEERHRHSLPSQLRLQRPL